MMAITFSELNSSENEADHFVPKAPENLLDYLEAKRLLVDSHLQVALTLVEGCPPSLLEAMGYGLLAPGKRLRPILVIMAAEACSALNLDAMADNHQGRRIQDICGPLDLNAMPAACAVEMVHAYSLIHDDLPAMDDDDLRRGQPTCHKKFGEALAILAGDALLTLAFQVLAKGYSPATAAGCCQQLAIGAGAAGMVGGQVMDLAQETADQESNGDLEQLEIIHARKTGALFRACLHLGAWSVLGEKPGGPDPTILNSLDGFGQCFGMLFQITDDLLDVESTSDQTGKRVQKDAARGKLTYPGLLGSAESRRRALELGERAQEHLKPLGPYGERLSALVPFILERKR